MIIASASKYINKLITQQATNKPNVYRQELKKFSLQVQVKL